MWCGSFHCTGNVFAQIVQMTEWEQRFIKWLVSWAARIGLHLQPPAPAVTPNYPGVLWCSSGSIGPSPCSPLPSKLWFTGFTLFRKSHKNTKRTAQGIVSLKKALLALMGCTFSPSSGIDWDDFRWGRRGLASLLGRLSNKLLAENAWDFRPKPCSNQFGK